MDPADIIAHAATLTEADLAAILRAKLPSRIGRHPIDLMLWVREDGTLSIDLFAGGECSACDTSIDAAVARLSGKLASLPSPQQRAAALRAEADKLDPQ